MKIYQPKDYKGNKLVSDKELAAKHYVNEEQHATKADKTAVAEGLAKKPDITMVGENGVSTFSNDPTGGILKFNNNDGVTESGVAVNDGSQDIYAQLYAKKTDTNQAKRLNVTLTGIYYTKDQEQPGEHTADDELIVHRDVIPFEEHVANDVLHVTQGDKDTWNAKVTTEQLASTKKSLQNEIAEKVASMLHWKGSVPTEADLPKENNITGDCYNITETGANWAWDGDKWDKLSEDISGLATKEELRTAREDLEANIATKVAITDYNKKVDQLQADIDSKATDVNFEQLTQRVTTLESTAADLESKKADKTALAETDKNLADYKVEVEGKLGTKVDQVTYDSKVQDLQNQINAKVENTEYSVKVAELQADINTRATQVEVSKIEGKVDSLETVTSGLSANKADKTELNAEITKVTEALNEHKTQAKEDFDSYKETTKQEFDAYKEEVTTNLGTKVDQSAYDTKVQQLETLIGTKVDQTVYEQKVQSIESTMASDKEELKSDIDTKASIDTVNAIDGRVSTLESTASNLTSRVESLEAIDVDQTYEEESTNAQSGKAVAEAITELKTGYIDTKIEDVNQKIETNKTGLEELTETVTDLTATVATKATESDLNAHKSDNVAHVTTEERKTWGEKINQAQLEAAKEELQAAIDTAVNSMFKYKGEVETENQLPNVPEHNVIGDVYNVKETGANYVWNGTSWDKLSENISGLAQKTDVDQLKTQVENLNQSKVEVTTYNAKIAELESTLGTKATEASVTTLTQDLETTKTSFETKLEKKADKETVNAQLELKANDKEVTEKLALKADTQYVNEELAKKATNETVAAVQGDVTELQSTTQQLQADLAKKAESSQVTTLSETLAIHTNNNKIHVSDEQVQKWDEITQVKEDVTTLQDTALTENSTFEYTPVASTAWGDALAASCNYFQVHMRYVRPGKLHSITIPGKDSTYANAAPYLTLFTSPDTETWTKLGTSTNTASVSQDAAGVWDFENLTIPSDVHVRFVFTADNTDINEEGDETLVGVTGMNRASDDLISKVHGSILDANYLARFTLTYDASTTESIKDHVGDSFKHFTGAEKQHLMALLQGYDGTTSVKEILKKLSETSTESNITEIREELKQKAEKSEVESLKTKVDSKADSSALDTAKQELQASIDSKIDQEKLDASEKKLEQLIDSKVESVFHWKGTVDTYEELESKQDTAQNGDVYNVTDKGGANYVWDADGQKWDKFSEDLTGFASSTDLTDHINDTDKHVTADAKTKWDQIETIKPTVEDLQSTVDTIESTYQTEEQVKALVPTVEITKDATLHPVEGTSNGESCKLILHSKHFLHGKLHSVKLLGRNDNHADNHTQVYLHILSAADYHSTSNYVYIGHSDNTTNTTQNTQATWNFAQGLDIPEGHHLMLIFSPSTDQVDHQYWQAGNNNTNLVGMILSPRLADDAASAVFSAASNFIQYVPQIEFYVEQTKDLEDHIFDHTVHVSDLDRVKWNNQVSTADFNTLLTNTNNHIKNATVHVTQQDHDKLAQCITSGSTAKVEIYTEEDEVPPLDERDPDTLYLIKKQSTGKMILTVKKKSGSEPNIISFADDVLFIGKNDYSGRVVETDATLDWGDGTELVVLTDDMGAENPLLTHTYQDNLEEHQITIEGQIKWGGFTAYYGPPFEEPERNTYIDNLRDGLVKIEIPEGSTSPIYDLPRNQETDPNNISGFFVNCSQLTFIPGNLFENCVDVTDFSYCFRKCTQFQSIPNNLFETCISAINFDYCFSYCTNLTIIPEDLFINCTEAVSFNHCFQKCSQSLIPDNLFEPCIKANEFSYCFSSCTNLQAIPDNLFASCTQATTFYDCFYNCNKLTLIPEFLFETCHEVKNFNSCFYNCYNITTIPQNIFANCSQANDFESCFKYCRAIESDLPDLWTSHGQASHKDCFCECTKAPNYNEAIKQGWACTDASQPGKMEIDILLTSSDAVDTGQTINIGPFLGGKSNNSKVIGGTIDWGDGTDKVRYLNGEDIASEKFKHNYTQSKKYTITIEGQIKWGDSTVGNNGDAFRAVVQAIRIPAGEISPIYDLSTNRGAFSSFRSITTIPENIFDNCTEVKDFSACFSECISITNIPTNLFAKCINATNFTAAFHHINTLTEIPAELFVHNIKATSFESCFANCEGIKAIPSKLFDTCTLAENFHACFAYGGEISSIPEDLFANCTHANNFEHCFYRENSQVALKLPELWKSHPDTTHDSCFCGWRKATNYNEAILYGWTCPKDMPTEKMQLTISIPDDFLDGTVSITDELQRIGEASDNPNVIGGIIDWGDGTKPTVFSDKNLSGIDFLHTYEEKGEHTITITGRIEWKTQNAGVLDSDVINLITSISIPDGHKSPIYSLRAPDLDNELYGGFNSAENLVSIPENLFENCTESINFAYCFCGCTKLQSIPENLFRKCVKATSFKACFRNCTSLTSVPEHLFGRPQADGDPVWFFYTPAIDYSYCFEGCTGIISSVETLWNYSLGEFSSSQTVDGTDCYKGCTLAQNYSDIPCEWGGSCNAISLDFEEISGDLEIDLGSMLVGYSDPSSKIKEGGTIDWGDGYRSSLVTDIYSAAFRYTYSGNCAPRITIRGAIKWLTLEDDRTRKLLKSISIPAGSSCAIYDLEDGAFKNCTALTSIPENLFENCTNKTNFDSCFEGCTSLSSIPDNLFANCTEITQIDSCFKDTGITKIPEHLFTDCSKLSFVNSAFMNCTNIGTIPDNLFANTNKLCNCDYLFANCTSLDSIPINLFHRGTQETFLSLNNAFEGCVGINGSLPEWWDDNNFSSDFHNDCFTGCVNATNYQDALDNYWANKTYKLSLTIDNTDALTEISLGDVISPYNLAPSESIKIDWGDGTYSEGNNEDYINAFDHYYKTGGIYTITIDGPIKFGPPTGALSVEYQHLLIKIDVPKGHTSAIYDIEARTFKDYTKLESIPENLLKNCTNTASFESLFENCISLTSIPESIFAMTGTEDDAMPAFVSLVATNYTKCFKGCIGLRSKLPNIWYYLMYGHLDANNIDGTDCFTGCTLAPNYNTAVQNGWATDIGGL